MKLKKSFFMSREDPILPTTRVRAQHAFVASALAFGGVSSREPAHPAAGPATGTIPVAVPPTPLFALAIFVIGAALCGVAGDVNHPAFVFSSYYQAVVGVVLGLLALWLLPPSLGRYRSHRQGPENRRGQPVGRRAAAPPVPPFGRMSGPVPVSPAIRLQVVPTPVTTC